jgi:hypothetical protein
MFLGKNNENIYGYTGKRSPSFNFASSSIQGSYKKPSDMKVKAAPVKTDKEKAKELFIKKISFSQNLSEQDLQIFCVDDTNMEEVIPLENETSEILNKKLQCKIGDDIVFEFVLSAHERGISIKMNSFLVHPLIQIQEDQQSFCFQKPSDLKVFETKFGFKHSEFPFNYVYESNPKCDEIFNDFILANLAEIKPPSIVTVPAKHTQSEISYRQHISYIKTRTLMNFKVDASGWYLDSFSETEEQELPAGITIRPHPFWTFFPGGKRIEHLLQFQ